MKKRIAHTVPLPTRAVKLFRELHLLTGCGELCFSGRQSAGRCISDMALLNGVRRMGFRKEEMTIHGFRAMFSTNMNEKSWHGVSGPYAEPRFRRSHGSGH